MSISGATMAVENNRLSGGEVGAAQELSTSRDIVAGPSADKVLLQKHLPPTNSSQINATHYNQTEHYVQAYQTEHYVQAYSTETNLPQLQHHPQVTATNSQLTITRLQLIPTNGKTLPKQDESFVYVSTGKKHSNKISSNRKKKVSKKSTLNLVDFQGKRFQIEENEVPQELGNGNFSDVQAKNVQTEELEEVVVNVNDNDNLGDTQGKRVRREEEKAAEEVGLNNSMTAVKPGDSGKLACPVSAELFGTVRLFLCQNYVSKSCSVRV